MSSSLPPHPRPRPVYSYSADSVGPYLSASSGSSAQRRTSQTFRPSPLAGPVLSYTSLSGLETSSTSHDSSCSSPATSSDGSHERMLKSKQRCASTGALPTLSEDGLQPPVPARTRSSRRSVVFASPSVTLSRTPSTSSGSGTPTLSSLISLSLSEDAQPRGSHSINSYQLDAHNATEPDPHFFSYRSTSGQSELTTSSVPSRRQSRLSFPTSPLPSLNASTRTSSASSLRSATSISSMATRSDCASPSSGADIKCDGRRVRIKDRETEKDDTAGETEKHRRRLSLVVPVEKHDWLTAAPTPVFSRSGLRAQGVIMPVSAREHQRERTISRPGSSPSGPTCPGSGRRAGDKTILDNKKPGEDNDEKKSETSEEKERRIEGTESKLRPSKSLSFGAVRRRSIFRVPSFASPESLERASTLKEDNTEASEKDNTTVDHGELSRSSESSSCVSPSSDSTSSSDPSFLTCPSTTSSSAASLPTSTSSLNSADAPSVHSDEQNLASFSPNKGLTQANLDEKHPSCLSSSSSSSSPPLTLLSILRKLTIRKPRRTQKSS